jgi:radical SAM superfamily enzyme YgiQ (UPF0313 family)
LNNKTVVLIAFYNTKALGVRYLENALLSAGYDVRVVFFKAYNSLKPKYPTEVELKLLHDFIKDAKPLFIGSSVMVSAYQEVVRKLNADIRALAPMVWGGVYATLFPEKCLEFSDYVIRAEGEEAIIELAAALSAGNSTDDIKNLAYKDESGKVIINPIRPMLTDLDKFGIPRIGEGEKYYIDNDTIVKTDPQISAFSYEMSASRGCPFHCTYCCSVNIMRVNKGGGTYVRFRSVDNVIEELKQAKRKMKKLVVVHFWDEIFSDDPEWVDEFVKRYKAEINLPFEIWCHPLKTEPETIRKLRSAGLYKAVMGIQSGSTAIRKDAFHRPESNEDILKSSKVLADGKVPQVIYDLMVRHEFETPETMRETYELTQKLARPFELQMHGLDYLPGSDIIPIAVERGLITEEEVNRRMEAPMSEQFEKHWTADKRALAGRDEINFWYDLTYISQFEGLYKKAAALAEKGYTPDTRAKLDKLVKNGQRRFKARYWKNKAAIIIKGYPA